MPRGDASSLRVGRIRLWHKPRQLAHLQSLSTSRYSRKVHPFYIVPGQPAAARNASVVTLRAGAPRT